MEFYTAKVLEHLFLHYFQPYALSNFSIYIRMYTGTYTNHAAMVIELLQRRSSRPKKGLAVFAWQHLSCICWWRKFILVDGDVNWLYGKAHQSIYLALIPSRSTCIRYSAKCLSCFSMGLKCCTACFGFCRLHAHSVFYGSLYKSFTGR